MSDILADDAAQPLRITKEVRMRKDTLEYDYHAKRTLAWRVIERLMRTGAEPIQLAAALVIIKRTDPEPSTHPLIPPGSSGAMLVTWESPVALPSSSPMLPNGSSTNPSSDSTYSFVTEDSVKPSSPSTNSSSPP